MFGVLESVLTFISMCALDPLTDVLDQVSGGETRLRRSRSEWKGQMWLALAATALCVGAREFSKRPFCEERRTTRRDAKVVISCHANVCRTMATMD